MKNAKLILDTNICKIWHTGSEYRVMIAMSEGGWLEHQPFPGELKGLISALDLSMNVLSGKFWVKKVAPDELTTRDPVEYKPRPKMKQLPVGGS